MQCSFQHYSPTYPKTSSPLLKLKAIICWTADQPGMAREGISFQPQGMCCSQMSLHSPSSSHDS